jgi:hypothetical protein
MVAAKRAIGLLLHYRSIVKESRRKSLLIERRGAI